MASPLITYAVNGGAATPLAGGASASIPTGAMIALALQSTTGVVAVSWVFKAPGTTLDGASFTPASLTQTLQFPVTPTTYTITTTVTDGTNTVSVVNALVAAAGTGAGNNSQVNLTLANGVNHDIVTDGSSVQRVGGPTLPWILTGLALNATLKAGVRGTIVNTTATLGAIYFEDASSTAANRFSAIRGSVATTSIAPLYLQPNGGSVDFAYDTTSNRILVTGSGYRRVTTTDPLDFKADPNGLASGFDNWQPIMDSIANASAASVSGTARGAASTRVELPPGFYYCFKPIVLDDPNVTDFGGVPGGHQITSSSLGGQIYRTEIRQFGFYGPQIAVIGQGQTPPAYSHYTTGGNDFYLMPLTQAAPFPYLAISDTHAGDISGALALCVEAFVNVPLGEGHVWGCISSGGRRGNESIANAFRIRLNSAGVTGSPVNVEAKLTTSVSGTVTITAGSLTAGGHWIACTYDGSFWRLYIDGSFVAHVAATGTVVQQPWESVTLGGESQTWPDHVSGLFGGPYSIGAVRISSTTSAGQVTATARYTSEVAPYTPLTSDAAQLASITTNDNFVQVFTPARTTAFAHGQFAIGQTGKAFAGQGAPLDVYSIVKGGMPQSAGIYVHDLGISGFSNGVTCYLAPSTRLSRLTIGTALSGISLGNNCYNTWIDDCRIDINTASNAHSWAVGLPDCGGIVKISRMLTTGGAYGYVLRGSPAQLDDVYHGCKGLGGVYINSTGAIGNLDAVTLEYCNIVDESGFITDAALFAANIGSLIVRGGSYQNVFSAALPMVKLDGVANADFNTQFYTYGPGSGAQTLKVLATTVNGDANDPCMPIVVSSGGSQTQNVPNATPWTDAACPLPIVFSQLVGQQKALNFASDADMTFGAGTPALFNDFFWDVIELTDTGVHLTTGRNVVLPIVVTKYVRTFINSTAQILTIKGPSGTGIAIAAGKTAILRSNGTNWVRVTPDT